MPFNWQSLRSLDDRKGVTSGPGFYLIGIQDPALVASTKDANYYGRNYPPLFRPRYVGMTMSLRSGVASRLRAHARGRGNQQVKDFISANGIKNLFYTYCECSDADSAEVIFLLHKSDDFLDWNNKGELLGAAKRFFFQNGPPEPLMLDHLEPEEQIAEIKSKRQMVQNWSALLDANPKYKKIAEDRGKRS